MWAIQKKRGRTERKKCRQRWHSNWKFGINRNNDLQETDQDEKTSIKDKVTTYGNGKQPRWKESTLITSLQRDIAETQKGKQNEKKKNLEKLLFFSAQAAVGGKNKLQNMFSNTN